MTMTERRRVLRKPPLLLLSMILAALLALAAAGCEGDGGCDAGCCADGDVDCPLIDGDQSECPLVDGDQSECPLVDGDQSECPLVDGDQTECPLVDGDATECPQVDGDAECPNCPPQELPSEKWAGSAHADFTAEAFTHWDEDDPAQIPTSCAKCHATNGMLDFLGADGSAAGTVEKPAGIGGVISCVACHNTVAEAKTSVVFPSGVDMTGLGSDAICMECHQGRNSGPNVDSVIEAAAVVDDDTPDADLRFQNIHYKAAAATRFGTLVKGGYEYGGMMYDGVFGHVTGYTDCIACHDAHSLEVKADSCVGCHGNDQYMGYRIAQASPFDYDGDGNVTEGIREEITTLVDILYGLIKTYSDEVISSPLVHEGTTYPYFFKDTNGNGEVDAGENVYANAFSDWTARLVRATYNYQYALKDPGAYAHNAKYVIQLLHDSIMDLNAVVTTQIDTTNMVRHDAGHFDGSTEAFRHWDFTDEGDIDMMVPASCAKCHTSEGLPGLIHDGAVPAAMAGGGLQCHTCHDDFSTYSVYDGAVTFPSGEVIDAENNSNLCLNCHQGRESTVSVNEAIDEAAPTDDDTVDEDLGFRNVHYFATGATRYGTEAKGGYEYDGKTYAGYFGHVNNFQNCADCHDKHTLVLKDDNCFGCHSGAASVHDIRSGASSEDYDGDGNTTEGIAGEIDGLSQALYGFMQQYANEVAGTDLIYDGSSYPYFFIDTNGNGQVDAGENIYPNRYQSWTARLVRASYNYQYSLKDPGAFAHNPYYTIQILYDSIEDLATDLGEDFSSYVRK